MKCGQQSDVGMCREPYTRQAACLPARTWNKGNRREEGAQKQQRGVKVGRGDKEREIRRGDKERKIG